MSKEKIKTVLLAMLFILSISLTQQLWISIPVADVIPFSQKKKVAAVEDIDSTENIVNILSPQSFIINFGGGLHTVFYSDAYTIDEEGSDGFWQETLRMLKVGYFQEGVSIEEINREKWMEASSARSIQLNFGYHMPISALRKLAEGKEGGILEKISDFDRILISLMEDPDIYVANSIREKYYRIKGKNTKQNLIKIVATIEKSGYDEEKGYDEYFAIQDIFSIENDKTIFIPVPVASSYISDNEPPKDSTNNSVLKPWKLNTNIPTIQVTQEIEPYNDKLVESFASTFFGESFDFVRKITETSGSVIYIYGYGEKFLKINYSGVLEYIEEIDPQRAGNPMEFWDAVKVAVDFVNRHGGWPNKYAYLKDVQTIEKEKRKGYAFIFGYRLNGLPVYYNYQLNPEPIEVHVIGKQVVHYKRYIKREKVAPNFLENEGDTAILTPLYIIDANFEKMRRDYLNHVAKHADPIHEENIQKQVLSSIQSVKLGYYDQPMRDPNKLIPVWVIELEPYIYYFNAYNGKMVNRMDM